MTLFCLYLGTYWFCHASGQLFPRKKKNKPKEANSDSTGTGGLAGKSLPCNAGREFDPWPGN